MDINTKVTSKTHTGDNFTNKKLLIEKVLKKQNVLKWLALFGAFLFQAIPYGVSSNILGNMQPFIVNGSSTVDGGYSGIFPNNFVLFTLVFTFGSLISALFAPLLGKLFGRANLKLLLGVGCIVSGGAFAMIGLLGFIFQPGVQNSILHSQRAAWLYGWYGICLIGSNIFSGLGVPFIIGSWFPGKNRGTVLGIAFAGGSAGNLIWQVAINQSLKVITVWDAFFIYGSVAIVAGLLISVLLINSPKVFKVDQNSQTLNQGTNLSKEDEIAKNGAGVKTTLGVPWFYLLSIGYAIFALGIAGVASQWPTFLRSGLKDVIIDKNPGNIKEYIANVATTVGLVYGISCLVGNLSGGILFSKLGVAKSFIIGGILRTIGSIVMLLGVFDPYYIAIGVGISGFTCYTYTSGSGFMATNLFGKKDSSIVIGLLGLAFAIGFAISTPLISGIQGDPEKVVSYFAGIKMDGNWLGVWIFTSIVTLLGSLFVAIFAAKIRKTGFLGMANANYSRYGLLVIKYAPFAYFKALKIWKDGIDNRLTVTYLNTLNEKIANWNDKKAKIINKENEKYKKIIAKTNTKYSCKLKNNDIDLFIVNYRIDHLNILPLEEKKINEKLAKIKKLIELEKNKINKFYIELINELKKNNIDSQNQEINGLINRLVNNEEMLDSDYDNKFVLKYLVKYTGKIMRIQKLEAIYEFEINPRLNKLKIQKAKLQKRSFIIKYLQKYSLTKSQKTHEQILNLYNNKDLMVNQIIDENVQKIKEQTVVKYQEKIDKLNDSLNLQNVKMTKNPKNVDKYQNNVKVIQNKVSHLEEKIKEQDNKLNNIENMWKNSEIFSKIIPQTQN